MNVVEKGDEDDALYCPIGAFPTSNHTGNQDYLGYRIEGDNIYLKFKINGNEKYKENLENGKDIFSIGSEDYVKNPNYPNEGYFGIKYFDELNWLDREQGIAEVKFNSNNTMSDIPKSHSSKDYFKIDSAYIRIGILNSNVEIDGLEVNMGN
ncbi:hypothetical protein AZF37_00945 [endosymbiont 'TC1' of Trimyema compressum]|uniref:hypothetical protein n=1 Tax=endosymbiont 'TC1' of Trimyema compressum TaxID=243899 RepID=UPI0007F0597F|nr:hypothetical protein [endosymbiont 'TC1' of Trimyema compressum]AMP19936.1 hypothetical protein AZF37_00945 [endosymbiont 'TC1' of Trimyema compressum]